MVRNSLNILFFFLIFMASCSHETFLTDHYWTIERVENISTGEVGPEEFNQGTVWQFNADKTLYFEMRNEYVSKSTKGTWSLKDNDLTLSFENDTETVQIEKLTESVLIWRMIDSDTLRFYLKSVQ